MQYRLTPLANKLKKFGDRYGIKGPDSNRYSWLSQEDHEIAMLFGAGASEQEVAESYTRNTGVPCSAARVARVRGKLEKLDIVQPVPEGEAPVAPSEPAPLMTDAGDEFGLATVTSRPAKVEPVSDTVESVAELVPEAIAEPIIEPEQHAGEIEESLFEPVAAVAASEEPRAKRTPPSSAPPRASSWEEPVLSDDISLFDSEWDDEPGGGFVGRGMGGGAFGGFGGRGKFRGRLGRGEGIGARFNRQRGAEEEAPPAKPKAASSRGYHLATFTLGPLTQVGAFFARLLESRWALVGLALAIAGVLLGFWNNRAQITADFAATIDFWYLVQRLIINLLIINVAEVMLRAGAIRRATGIVPKIHVDLRFTIVHMVPWLFMHADLSAMRHTRDKAARYRIVGAPLVALALVILATGLVWMMSRRNGSLLHVYAMETHILAWVFFAFAINPFAKSDLSHLIGMRAGIPGLRGTAFQALLDPEAIREAGLPVLLLRCYAIASAVFIVVAVGLLAYHGGRWLMELWGGLGVAYCLMVFAFLAYGPAVRLSKALARKRESSPLAVSGPESQRRWQKRFLLLAVIALVAIIPYDYETAGSFELLPVRKTSIHAEIEGEVRAVLVAEGDWVRRGQVLARLANEEQRRDVDESEQRIEELSANLRKAINGATPEQLAVARQNVALAQTKYVFSRQAADRYRELMQSKFVSPQAYEDKEAQASNDLESLRLAQKNLEQLLAGTRPEDIDAIRAQLEQEKANLQYYRSQLEFTEIRSPLDGRIVSGTLMYAVGDHLTAEDALLSIEDSRTLLVQVKVPENDIAIVPEVAEVRVRTWTLPETVLPGRVTAVAPAADSEQYWRVVRVLMEFDNSRLNLPSGLTGYAKINCKTMPLIQAFSRMLVRFVMVEVWSWLP